MGDFLAFRRFIAPVVMQIIFWLGVVGMVAGGIYFIVKFGRFGGEFILQGVLMILIGPLVVRLYCEIIIIFFRINESLNAIRYNTQPQGQGYPPAPQQGYPPAQPQGYPPPQQQGYPPPNVSQQRW